LEKIKFIALGKTGLLLNKILIFGLNGLLGWNLYLEAKKSAAVFCTYRRCLPEFEASNFYKIDIRDENEIQNLVKEICPDIILHAWSMCDLDVCEENPDLAYEINVKGTQKILAAAESIGCVKKFVYLSTDHVFSGDTGAYDESDLPSPKHVYGVTKVKAEALVSQSSLSTLIIRPGLVIGSSVQGNKGPHDFLMSRLKAGKETRYFTDEYRTPIKAINFAKATLQLALSDETGIFHIAGHQRWSRYDLAKKMAKTLDMKTEKITPYKRADDQWALIRPKDLSLNSNYLKPFEDFA
jgi:dTDP-4-dehydrorhamnose reductase